MTAPGASMFLDQAEIVVIGSGPAGASAAAVLAEYGHDVLLVDKDPFPRDKPCGDGLTRAVVAAIFGRGPEFRAAGQEIEAHANGPVGVVVLPVVVFSESGSQGCDQQQSPGEQRLHLMRNPFV